MSALKSFEQENKTLRSDLHQLNVEMYIFEYVVREVLEVLLGINETNFKDKLETQASGVQLSQPSPDSLSHPFLNCSSIEDDFPYLE